MTRSYSNASKADRIAPEDLGTIGITAGPDDPWPIGIAYGAGHVGGWRWDWNRPGSEPEYLGKPEAVWRLVVGKVEVEGRFVLQADVFVELAEGTERELGDPPTHAPSVLALIKQC
jgi:hypothetical protein